MTDRGLLDYNDLCECKNTFPGILCAQAIIEDCGCVPLGIACEQADLFGVSCEYLGGEAAICKRAGEADEENHFSPPHSPCRLCRLTNQESLLAG